MFDDYITVRSGLRDLIMTAITTCKTLEENGVEEKHFRPLVDAVSKALDMMEGLDS